MDRLFETKSDDYYPEAGDLVCIDLNPILGHEQSGHRVRVFTSAQSQSPQLVSPQDAVISAVYDLHVSIT
jgi:hypothetical protein